MKTIITLITVILSLSSFAQVQERDLCQEAMDRTMGQTMESLNSFSSDHDAYFSKSWKLNVDMNLDLMECQDQSCVDEVKEFMVSQPEESMRTYRAFISSNFSGTNLVVVDVNKCTEAGARGGYLSEYFFFANIQ
jgi:hypothetical protein